MPDSAGFWLLGGGTLAGTFCLCAWLLRRLSRALATQTSVAVNGGTLHADPGLMPGLSWRPDVDAAFVSNRVADRQARHFAFLETQQRRQFRQAAAMTEAVDRAMDVVQQSVRQAGANSELEALLSSALAELDRVAQNVRLGCGIFAEVVIVPSDLQQSLEALAVRTEDASLLYVDTRIEPALNGRITEAQAGHALVVVREALTNVVGHSQANRVAIKAVVEGRRLVVSVSDDGNGFHVVAARSGSTHGLRNMQAHAEAARGLLQVESAAGAGTVVTLTIPVS